MSDLALLKERIYDEGRVGQLLEELGCDSIQLKSGRSGDDLVTARLPDSANKRSVQVYLSKHLNSEIVNRNVKGDIYSIVGYLLYECESFDDVKAHLYQIKTFVCNALGYDDLLNQPFIKPEPKIDWNWWLRPIQKERIKGIEIVENPILDEIILNEFVPYPWGEWYLKDGISLETQKMYDIGFHVRSEHVTIPIRNKHGQLIGVKGRYVGSDKEILEHKKYSYIYSCAKSIELYNLDRSLPYIQEKKEVIVVEGAKTTMKLWDCNIRNAVSIEGDKLNPVQAKLLKELGLDIDHVYSWDKGKDEDFVKKQLKQIKNRRVFYLYDNADRFEDKNSPTDKGIDVFLDLYNNDKHEYK
jgi:DNA primase